MLSKPNALWCLGFILTFIGATILFSGLSIRLGDLCLLLSILLLIGGLLLVRLSFSTPKEEIERRKSEKILKEIQKEESSSALKILKERFAKGEITEEEYLQKKNKILID